MAKTYLGDWGSYYRNTNTATPSGSIDWQTRWKIQYEQSSDGITTIYVQPYLKIHATRPFGNGTSTVNISTTINGTTKTQSISNYTTVSEGTFYKYGVEQTFTIKHEQDGTAQCKFSGFMSGVSAGEYRKTASHTWPLPTINMASSITNNTSANNRFDIGANVVFTIARPNNTITHTLTYNVNGTNYTIDSGIAESKTYAFPPELVYQYPANSEMSIVVTCTSSNGTIAQTPVYLKIPASYVPAISLDVSDVGVVPSNWGIWVKTKSKLKGVVTANGAGGSTISSYTSKVDNQTYYGTEFVTPELSKAGTININSTVTDSRGRTASTSDSVTVVDYFTPTYTKLEIIRCNESGEEDNEGTYGKLNCQYSIAPCSNKNAKSLKVSYGSETKTFELTDYSGTITATTSQLFSGLDVTANHTFTIKLIDTFNPNGISQTYVMPPSFVLVSKKAGGKGITFGQIATQDGFHCHMDATFHDEIFANNIVSKNLFNFNNLKMYEDVTVDYINKTVTVNHYANGSVNKLKEICPDIKVGETYILSFNTTSIENFFYLQGSSEQWFNGTSRVITQADLDNPIIIYGAWQSTDTFIISNIQIEKGNMVTGYVPYKNYGSEDTGWITLNQNIKYRKVGNMVTIVGNANNTQFGNGAYTTIGTLPEGFRPSIQIPFTYHGQGGNPPGMSAFIYPYGNIDIYSSTLQSIFKFTVSYPVD